MVWFRKLFDRSRVPSETGGAEFVARVLHDDRTITLRQPDGRVQLMAWEAVSRVVVQTTDSGPFAADLFWIVEDSEGHGLTIPMGSSGESELLKSMQRRLEAFDNMAVVEAMGSSERAQFVVWEADGE